MTILSNSHGYRPASQGDGGPPTPSARSSGRARDSRALLAGLGQLLAVAAVVVVATFVMVRIVPGDAVNVVSATHGTAQTRAALRAELHLNDSLPEQFRSYVVALAQGDLGRSLVQQSRPVTSIVGQTLPATLAIIVATILVACLIGIPVGLFAALARGRGVDAAVRTAMSLLLASPPFFLGLLLIMGPSLALGWLPAGGWAGRWPENTRFVVLPSLALAGYLIPQVGRVVRQAALDAVREQWYEAALARGLAAGTLVGRHVLKNSLLPVVTLVGLNTGALIAGAVVVESVFGIPGIGQQLITAVEQRDYPVIQGIVLVTAIIVVIANLCTDLAYRFVDPRTGRA